VLEAVDALRLLVALALELLAAALLVVALLAQESDAAVADEVDEGSESDESADSAEDDRDLYEGAELVVGGCGGEHGPTIVGFRLARLRMGGLVGRDAVHGPHCGVVRDGRIGNGAPADRDADRLAGDVGLHR